MLQLSSAFPGVNNGHAQIKEKNKDGKITKLLTTMHRDRLL